ncbi:MAG: hypothetical protein JWN57_2919, partial [Frankiales bacterium]|nr:hypothetical protein [Frankiales bacterium]
AGSVAVALPGKTVTLPAVAAQGVRRLLQGPCAPADLAVGGLDGEDALVLARRMVREGVLMVDGA